MAFCDTLPSWIGLAEGQVILVGEALTFLERLDRILVETLSPPACVEVRYPTFIAVETLAKMQYFKNFPHLITLPVSLDPDAANLEAFAASPYQEEALHETAPRALTLQKISPVTQVLTPAACYHIYQHFSECLLTEPLYVTTRATCFRKEAFYSPLRRQWNFSMREVVCLGTREEVHQFLDNARLRVTQLLETLALPVQWETATDPFFKPAQNPKYLMQKLDPVKQEMVLQEPETSQSEASTGPLAIGSINFHHDSFGEVFQIRRQIQGQMSEGASQSCYSGCVAFGLERWIAAFLAVHGSDPAVWLQQLDKLQV